MKKILVILALILVCFTSNAKKIDYTVLDSVVTSLVSSTIPNTKVDTTIMVGNKEVHIVGTKHSTVNYQYRNGVYCMQFYIKTNDKKIKNHCIKELFPTLDITLAHYTLCYDGSLLITKSTVIPSETEIYNRQIRQLEYDIQRLNRSVRNIQWRASLYTHSRIRRY